MSLTILIADDDVSIRTVLERACERRGFSALSASNGNALLQLLESGCGDLLVMDVMMPIDGALGSSFELMPRIKELRPELPVVVISAQAALPNAVKANRLGAYEFLSKPFDLDALFGTLQGALSHKAVNSNAPALPSARAPLPTFMQMMGSSGAMQNIYRVISRVVDNDLTVMITGESGTGKELVARAIHELGNRSKKPFMAINMAAIPRELVESELFGHEKGAFTGAVARKAGLFEQADGGTLFLDEIGDMPVEAQSKLLRVLQQGEFTTVGGHRLIRANVRICCATHRDLLEKVRMGQFREDLYYRLNVVPVHVPPLKSRKEDIPELVNHLLQRAVSRGLPPRVLHQDALQAMMHYDWPGNVRELENMLYRLMALSADETVSAEVVQAQLPSTVDLAGVACLEELIAQHLQQYFAAHGDALPPKGLHERIMPLMERPLMMRTLQAVGGNQVKAAEWLGINRNTLRKRLRELKVVP